MAAGGLDGVFDAERPGPADANNIAINTGLGDQSVDCSLEVLRPQSLSRLTTTVFGLAAALAVCAAIDGEDVDAGNSKQASDVAPRLASAIALVIEDHAWTGPGRGEIRSLEDNTVGSCEINNARCGRLQLR